VSEASRGSSSGAGAQAAASAATSASQTAGPRRSASIARSSDGIAGSLTISPRGRSALRRTLRKPVVALAASLLAAGLAAGLRAQAEDAETTARAAELERIRGEIAELTSRIEVARQRAAGLEGDIERSQLELDLQERRVAEAQTEYELAQGRVAEAEARITDLERRLATERRRLEDRLTGLYRLGRHGMARLAFSLQPGEDPVAAVRLLRYLARRDAASVERFEDLRARLANERAGLEQDRAAAAAWLDQQASRRDELARLERRQRELLAGTRSESERLAERAAELTQRAERLSALLDALYGRNTEALAGRPIQDFRGLLTWPARGRVTAEFGPRLDPRYGTRVPHHGVDLATVPGEPVRAVYPGKVVFAAPFETYGPTVVVQHAGRAFTLYAGLGEAEVARGDLVSLNAELGRAAESLYFEIRVDNRPEDPRHWVR
jgi:septal ring factor EnvC (AmiA/AmiB activator)